MKIFNKIMHFLIFLYIIVLPLFYEKLKIWRIPISGDLILALLFGLYFIKVLFSKEERKKFFKSVYEFFNEPLTIFMAVLFGMMIVSILYAKDKSLAGNESFRFASYILLYFIVKYALNEKINNAILKVFIILSAVVGLFGILQFFTNIGLDKKFIANYNFGASKRIASVFDNPDNFGAFIIIAIFPVIMLAIYEKNKIKKIVLSLVGLLLLINIPLTGSRNAYLGFIIGSIVLCIFASWKVLFVLLGAGIPSMLIPQIRTRLLQLGSSSETISRIKIWKTALMMIKEHPLLGVGNGNFVSYYDAYTAKYKDLYIWEHFRYPSHNSYLKVESELGIVGIISFLGILILGLRKIFRFIKTTDNKYYKYFYTGFLASSISFYFMNLADNLFFVPKTTAYFWLLLAVCDSLIYKNRFRTGE